MRKIFLCISAMCCLLWACSDEDSECSGNETPCPENVESPCSEEPVCSEELICPEVPVCECPGIEAYECQDTIVNRCMSGACPEHHVCASQPEVTLYFDIPRSTQVFYHSENNGEVSLTAKGNDCVDILTDSIVTDAIGYANIEMKAKKFDCPDGEKIKVCLPDNDDSCAEIAVHILTDSSIDENHNRMIDEFEINTDKDKYKEDSYKPGDCSSFCHDDGDCEDFCDSAIGFRCSTRCTSDDQCIKYPDADGNWVSMICRADGRCAYPEFKVVYNIKKAGAKVTMGGGPFNQNENVTIDWGDATDADGKPVSKFESVPGTTNNNLSHTYKTANKYTVTIRGDYRNWTAGCSSSLGIDIDDVEQFGQIGLGDSGNIEHGSFTGCEYFNKISAKDIPDATKLISMNSMFSGLDIPGKAGVGMYFDAENVTRWDTSNVRAMFRTFWNAGDGDKSSKPGFRQDIGRWNVSKVKTTKSMFQYAIAFNANIGCWDTSSFRNMSYMFDGAVNFNQNLENWDLDRVTEHDTVFQHGGSHIGAISLKNYCILRSRLYNEDIGRDSAQCYKPVTYAGMCADDNWKESVKKCHDKGKFKDKTEDTMTCANLIDCGL